MKVNGERSRSDHGGPAGLAVLVAAAAIAVAAFAGSGSAPAASSGKSASDVHGTFTTALSKKSGGNTTTTSANGSATDLVDAWAGCERSHGDPNQADPTIDAHGVINITTPPLGSGAMPAGDPHDVTGTCSEYLAAAQRALRAADPVQDPLGMNNQADLLKYVNCMRADGVPNYPYPTGNTTNFQGTGVDPTSPFVVKISIECGNKLGLPLWWSAGWGPPGDISVSAAGVPNNPPPCFFEKKGCGANGGAVPGARFSPRRPPPGWPRAAGPATPQHLAEPTAVALS